MRLFAAVLLPERVVAELADEVGKLQTMPGADRLRWTAPVGWHFTLAFYGEVAEDVMPELSRRLALAAHRHQPFDLRLAGGGRFSRSVVWVGADGNAEAMRRLADSAAASGRRAGVPMEERRPYAPHLTIARNRTQTNVRQYVEALAGFEGSPWTVDEMCLMRSNLPKSGRPGEKPRYETVGAWSLGA